MPKDLRRLTKLRKEEALRKEFQQDAEEILTIGQESESKAKKWVDESAKKMEAADQKEKDQDLSKLEKLRRLPKIFSYKEQLAMRMAEIVKESTVPKGYGLEVLVEEKGVGIKVNVQNGRGLRRLGYRRFAVCGDPVIDYNYIYLLADWAHNLMNKKEEKKTENGIILP